MKILLNSFEKALKTRSDDVQHFVVLIFFKVMEFSYMIFLRSCNKTIMGINIYLIINLQGSTIAEEFAWYI